MRHIKWMTAGVVALGAAYALAVGCGYTPDPLTRMPPVRVKTPKPKTSTAVNILKPKPTPAPTQSVKPTTPPSTGLKFKATFRGEPLAGHTVQLYDARTLAPLASGNGSTVTTDEGGAFRVELATLKPGQALRVVAHKGRGAIEGVFTAESAAGGVLLLDEGTTALAKLVRTPVSATRILTEAGSEPVLHRLQDFLPLVGRLKETMMKQPRLAEGLVTFDDLGRISKQEASSLRLLLDQASRLETASELVAGLIVETARQAGKTANLTATARHAATAAELEGLALPGTVLGLGYESASARLFLTNSVTHQRYNAASVDLDVLLERIR